MGKKTKKTRWRTLSIGDGCSDTETNVNETSRNNQKYSRTNGTWYNANNQKYSNQSTPIKHQYQTNGGHYHNHNHRNNGHYARSSSHQETSKSTTRSSSTVSEHKIKFNEDEYTRITTPRQDVLFKKGYLSKPKPYLQQQRSLTSTGNSTGDGTPDHQSADGNDVVDSDYDQSPFMFPATNSGAFIDGMFFVNGFEPYAVPPHHVLVYDQYGNAVVCLPPPQLQQPPLTTTTTATTATTATIFERRSKRYSTDSMTESTSPHNESNQDANDTDEAFLCVPSASATTQIEAGTEDPEQIVTSRIRKKRRRKKIERNRTSGDGDGGGDGDGDGGEVSSDELSSLSGDEIEGEQQNETNKCDRDEAASANSCKYRVDAEEFIPRCYQQPQPQPHMEFVQLPVGMPFATFVPTMYPLTNHQIYFNNPHHFSTTSTTPPTVEAIETTPEVTTTTTSIEPSDETSVEPSEETTKCDNHEEETTTTTTTTGAIDIAKIVSKLEQAAKEQQQVIDTTISTTTTTTINSTSTIGTSTMSTSTMSTTTMNTSTIGTSTMSSATMSTTDVESVDLKPNQIELIKETNKTESVPLTTTIQPQQQQQLIKHQATNTVESVRYSERLKQSQNHNHVLQIKPQPQVSQPPQQQQQQQQTKLINKQRRTTNQTCPRLERSASSKPKTITNSNSSNNNNNNLKTIPPTTTTTTTSRTVVSNNQWIAVSGKKKRGKNKQLLPEPEELQPPQQIEEQLKQVEEVIKPETIKPNEETSTINTKDIEVKVQRVTTPATIKSNPTKKPSTIKKRILINDDLIVANNVIVGPKQNIEEKTVVPVEQPETNKQQSNATNKPKKKPNKKSKNKSTSKSSECNNNIDKTTNNEPVAPNQNVSEPEDDLEVNKRDDSDDVSLELDRMIQRGLYGNLEQRLRSFNPADSFLKQTQTSDIPNVNAATAAASVIGTMAAAVLKKPSTYFAQTSGINGFIPPKVIVTQTTNNTTIDLDENVARSTRNDSESSVASSSFLQEHQRFPITRAVREWMNKTRENTPEVEIFKKPNEIREEFNLIIQPQGEPINEVIEEIENGIEVHQVVDEMSSLGAPDDDLLDCWEPEINYDQQQEQHVRRRSKSQSIEQQQQEQPIVEQAEDVLETYESVYGRSDDFSRIQREVQQQQQRTTTSLNNNNNNNNSNPRVSGVDGALPYRAICCSIM